MKRLTQFKLGATSTKHVPTPCNMPQQGGQIDATYCATVLHDVASLWPGVIVIFFKLGLHHFWLGSFNPQSCSSGLWGWFVIYVTLRPSGTGIFSMTNSLSRTSKLLVRVRRLNKNRYSAKGGLYQEIPGIVCKSTEQGMLHSASFYPPGVRGRVLNDRRQLASV